MGNSQPNAVYCLVNALNSYHSSMSGNLVLYGTISKLSLAQTYFKWEIVSHKYEVFFVDITKKVDEGEP